MGGGNEGDIKLAHFITLCGCKQVRHIERYDARIEIPIAEGLTRTFQMIACGKLPTYKELLKEEV